MYLTEPKINTQRANNIKNGINALNMNVVKLILENRQSKYQIIISKQYYNHVSKFFDTPNVNVKVVSLSNKNSMSLSNIILLLLAN